jgi:hypothetical protein
MEQQPVQPVEGVTEPKTSGLGRLFGAFFEPSKVFTELARKPSWVWPVVVLMVVALAAQLVIAPRFDMEATVREQMAQSGRQMTEQQLEQAVAFGGTIAKVAMYASPVFVPILLLVLTGLYALGLRLAGGEAEFGRLFSGVAHAITPPMLVASVLTIVVAVQRDSLVQSELENLVRSNLGAWLGPDTHKALVAAASVLDVFNLWQAILVVLALQIIGKIKQSQAIGVVATVWVVWIVIKAGLAFLR